MWTPLKRAAVCGAALAAMGAMTPAAVATAQAAGSAGVAPAAEAETRLYAPSALVLTVAKGETATHSTPLRAVTLTCVPSPGGTHPAAQDACATLWDVEGEFKALRGDEQRACIKIYDPVVVTAQGVWEGRRVDFERTYGNACELNVEGTSVFSF